MKRSAPLSDPLCIKKPRINSQQSEMNSVSKPESEVNLESGSGPRVPDLTEDLLYEILRRADEKTLGAAACVSSKWRRLAADERIWEAVCVRHWARVCDSADQLRYVVATLGGFRKIYVTLLHQIVVGRSGEGVRRRKWSKDELQMSLAMMSVGMFGKMSVIQPKKK